MPREVAPGVTVHNLGWVNVVWIRTSDGWLVVDAGLPGSTRGMLRTLARRLEPAPLRWLLITHAHPDHAGGAAALQRESGCEVWGSELERRYLERPELGGPPRPPRSELAWWQRWMALAAPQTFEGVRLARGLLPGEGLEALRPGMSVIGLPGHTPGQIGLWLERERVAIVADALMHLLPWLHPPIAAFTSDRGQAERSVARLLALAPRVLIPGHGPPLVAAGDGDLVPQLRAAQLRFAASGQGAVEPLFRLGSRV
jgi:glyoxylase-like metal-dependent hydrolase (beta-lactamase superfamily II)